ncbi:MAG: methylmalonyl-CoA mutase [Rhodospirillales bacterium]|nr:methylmalonyl-CoA mutase [Rhodospirillales bacterium]
MLSRDREPAMVKRLQDVSISGGNLFEVLIEAVRVLSLGQISHTLFEVGGKYRRSM